MLRNTVGLFKRDIWVEDRCCQRKRRVALIVGWGIVLWTIFFVVITGVIGTAVDMMSGGVLDMGIYYTFVLYAPQVILWTFVAWTILWTGRRPCCRVALVGASDAENQPTDPEEAEETPR